MDDIHFKRSIYSLGDDAISALVNIHSIKKLILPFRKEWELAS